MDIKVLGPGCANCVNLHRNATAAVTELGLDVKVEKVTDYQEIMKYGIMRTPGLVVNGEVKVFGRVPNKAEIVAILKALQ